MSDVRPLVSVVMSCFNDESHVAASVDSIRRQSLQNWEFIIINDGSTDGTAAKLDSIASSDSRIRVIHQENTGLTKALMRGCLEARAEFIARQDADDLSLPTRLEKQLKVIQQDDAIGLVSCFADYIGPDDEFLSTVTRPIDPGEATNRLMKERLGPPAHGTVLFRKSLYEAAGGYRPEFYFGQDADLWLRMVSMKRIAYVPEVLYLFRWHPGSITGSNRNIQREFGRIGQELKEARATGKSEEPLLAEAQALTNQVLQLKADKTKPTRREANRLAMLYQVGSQLVKNRDHRARGYLWTVLRRQPWNLRAWIRLCQSLLNARREQ